MGRGIVPLIQSLNEKAVIKTPVGSRDENQGMKKSKKEQIRAFIHCNQKKNVINHSSNHRKSVYLRIDHSVFVI